ncbi:beta-ketoacyl synthase chain length factor [Pasteurellaceae bacterium LIM206]|nr:beta-ketoacyl synthase chain length factor [Pasteurellaceae bacterium LIM206]
MTSFDDWYLWAKGQDISTFVAELDFSFLTAMQRRRLSPFARLVFAAAHPLNEFQIPIVFMSRDGEFTRSFDLLNTLAASEMLSPTSFGLSVHNSVIGQWSLLYGNKQEMTALSSREDGLETAFLESFLFLQEHKKVLVIVAEDPLPFPQPIAMENKEPFAYAAAFLVEKGDDIQLSLEKSTVKNNTVSNVAGNLTNLRNLLLDKKEWQHNLKFSQRCWQWKIK